MNTTADDLINYISTNYGYDFSNYARVAFDRRLSFILKRYELQSIQQLILKLESSDQFFSELISHLTVGTTEFFRDPEAFNSLITTAKSYLLTYSTPKIWIVGCSSGEELVSLSILLNEANLLQRSRIYATDINPTFLQSARKGQYVIPDMELLQKSYLEAGGQSDVNKYFTKIGPGPIYSPSKILMDKIIFGRHNVAMDNIFCDANLIVCRNVLIYFNSHLQNRVIDLFKRSLTYRGFLWVGKKETVKLTNSASYFETTDESNRIFRLKEVL